MKIAARKIIFALAILLLTACASWQEPSQEPVYVTQKQFVEDIFKPIFKLIVVLSTFYKKSGEAPENAEVLQTFASSNNIPLTLDTFSRFVLTRTGDDLILSFDIALQDDEAGQIKTSWLLRKTTSLQDADTGLTIWPNTTVCVKREPPKSTLADLFLQFAIGVISKSSAYMPQYTCFQPPSAQSRSQDHAARNKLREQLRKHLEREMQLLPAQ